MRGLLPFLARLKRPMPEVGKTPADVVHRENKWRLLRYRPSPEGRVHRTPIVMVPSLINRHYVLDLMPGKSLAEWLVDQGHDVYCIDWGTPGPEDRYLDLDDFADRYLGRAVRAALRTSGSAQAHLLGYCMGGIFTAIYAARHREHVASLVQLAAPVRFSEEGDQAVLNHWTRSKGFDVDTLVRATGIVPWQILQGSFQLLRPTLTLSKVMHVLDRAWTDESLDGFLALETWGNDNVGLPGRFYERYIEDLYRGDQLHRGTLSIAGQRVRLGDIECPLLAVTFGDDYIVPWRSAAAIVDAVSSEDTTHVHLPGGHVGAVVSRSAKKRLWPTLSHFWAERDGAPTTEPARKRAADVPGKREETRP